MEMIIFSNLDGYFFTPLAVPWLKLWMKIAFSNWLEHFYHLKISVCNTILSHTPPVVKKHDTLLTHVNGISCHKALVNLIVMLISHTELGTCAIFWGDFS